MKIMIRIAGAVCMLLSAALPAIAILVLYSIRNVVGRLIAIVLMSLLFAGVMTLVTSRSSDVFIAVTAFSAVLVVWVGSANVMT